MVRDSGSKTVDSRPTVVGPASRTASMRPERSASTWAAVVGLVWPKVLALGAAMGSAAARRRACAALCEGMRTPTSGRPAVTASGMLALRGKSKVNGPGQKALARASIRGWRVCGILVMVGRSSAETRWTIRGSQEGRCLAENILAMASSERAFAPRP